MKLFIPFEKLIIQDAPVSPRHAESLASLGMIYAPIVYPADNGMYVVRDGRGRCLEARDNGLDGIECEVQEGDETTQHLVSLAANVARRDNPMGNAEDIEFLLTQINPATGEVFTQDEIARMSGCSQSKISQLYCLTGLIPEIRDMVRRGKNSGGIAPKAGYAAAVLTREEQEELAKGGPFTIDQVKKLKIDHISAILNLGNTGIVRPEELPGVTLSADQVEILLSGGGVELAYGGKVFLITAIVDE